MLTSSWRGPFVGGGFHLSKEETLERLRNPVDLPGRRYLQATVELFKKNRFAKGRFVDLDRRLSLKDPIHLLAVQTDDIFTKEQVFDAEKYFGAAKDKIEKKLVPQAVTSAFSWA